MSAFLQLGRDVHYCVRRQDPFTHAPELEEINKAKAERVKQEGAGADTRDLDERAEAIRSELRLPKQGDKLAAKVIGVDGRHGNADLMIFAASGVHIRREVYPGHGVGQWDVPEWTR